MRLSHHPPAPLPPSSGLCIASLILGILGLCTGITSIPAVILGHMGLSKIKKSAGRLGGGGMAIAGLTTGYIGLAGLLFFVSIMAIGLSADRKERNEARERFDMSAIPVPTRLERHQPEPLGDQGVTVGAVRIHGGSGPGSEMWMRVYLPAGTHSAGSLPAVLVAPAGTNLISGVDVGPPSDDDYHEECLPYAEAGMAVVFYSLDGAVVDEEDEEQIKAGYKAFRAAGAGVVNGRNALEYVLAEMPEVDPDRIYSAGHSSAGTLSLLLAAHEPRLAGSLAYAPATDVEKQLADIVEDPMASLFLPDVDHFVKRSSPVTHVSHLSQPLFLFHAEDDETASIEDVREFIRRLEESAPAVDVSFQAVEEGGHYLPMVEEGIPAGIEWIRGR